MDFFRSFQGVTWMWVKISVFSPQLKWFCSCFSAENKEDLPPYTHRPNALLCAGLRTSLQKIITVQYSNLNIVKTTFKVTYGLTGLRKWKEDWWVCRVQILTCMVGKSQQLVVGERMQVGTFWAYYIFHSYQNNMN